MDFDGLEIVLPERGRKRQSRRKYPCTPRLEIVLPERGRKPNNTVSKFCTLLFRNSSPRKGTETKPPYIRIRTVFRNSSPRKGTETDTSCGTDCPDTCLEIVLPERGRKPNPTSVLFSNLCLEIVLPERGRKFHVVEGKIRHKRL